MDEQELKGIFLEFIEEYNHFAGEKVFEKLYKIHRGNLINLIRAWKEEGDRMRVKK